MFVYFFKGPRGNYIGRHQGKLILPPDGQITNPGLYEIRITNEQKTCYRVEIIGPAAVLEVSDNGETRSVRLQHALNAFGPYDERSVVNRSDEPVLRLFWSGIGQQQFDQEIGRRIAARSKSPTPFPGWSKDKIIGPTSARFHYPAR